MHIQLQLKAVKTRTELATKLGVDIKSLNLVSFTSSKCNDVNCNLPAVNGNYGNCILHQQTWYPRKLTTTGEEAINCRGHGLYGPQFMRTYNNKTQKKTCCCNSKLCEEIGYSHQGMMHLPTKEDECKEALRVMGIAACDRQEIWDNRSDHRVAYWHYNQRHLMMGSNGKYKFRKRAKYYDDDNKEFTCPPPNNKIEHYIDQIKNENGYIRGGYDDSLPSWYKSMAKLQVTTAEIPQSKTNNATTPRRNGGSNKVPRVVTPTSATSPRGKRSSPESSELEELREQARLLQAQLNSALDCIEGLTATVELKDEEMIRIKFERDNLLEENAELKAKIEKIEQQKCYISYDDLRTGGKLSEFVNDFTFFPSFDSVDAFLGVINYTEGCKPGDGLCENLRRYSKISVAERKKYNDSLKNGTDTVDETAQDGDDDAMSISSDAGTGLSDIADEAMEESDSNGSAGDTSTSPRSRRRKLSWKDEFLVYCFYAKCNLSMRRTGALFGIKQTLVHDIVMCYV
jgi:hypothetical protein